MNFQVARIKAGMQSLCNGVGVLVTVEWLERTGGTQDVVTGSRIGGSCETKRETFRALKQDVTSQMVERIYSEMRVGDVILDCDPAQLPSGREYSSFTIDGQRYTSQKIGPQLTQAWDAQFGGVKTARTLLLRPAM